MYYSKVNIQMCKYSSSSMYNKPGVSGGVCLQSSPQLSGKCKSNGVIVPPHPSSKLQGEAVKIIGGVLAVLLDVSVGVGGQK